MLMPEMFQSPTDLVQQQAERVNKSLQRAKYKIAVLSGKGGVGKTFVAVNIAATLAKQHSIGLLDADIDCPNVGKMLGIDEKFKMSSGKLRPIEKYSMKIASMSFFDQPEGMPAIWRGPIIHKAILQLVEMAEWGDLDYFIFDLPPGTSDAAMTVMQFLQPDAAVIVTTPQELALMDAAKSARMVRQFGKPFGIVENMAGDVFGSDGKQLAEELDAPLLGSLPLAKEIRVSCDRHEPIALSKSKADEKHRKEFERIVDNLKKKVLSA